MSNTDTNNNLVTNQEVENYNRFTFFPTTTEKVNQSLQDSINQDRSFVKESLKKWGYSLIPQDIESLLARVAQARKYMFIAESKARLLAPGAMIVGPANYLKRARPERAEKVREKALAMFSLAQARLNSALNKLDPNAPISSDDPEAIEKLTIRIERAEQKQQTMVQANKIIKSKKFDLETKIFHLKQIGVGAERLKPNCFGDIGFAAFEISNNSKNIKRMKDRVKELEAKKNDITKEWSDGKITITDNVEENRVQIAFPGKPEQEVIDQLKKNGFHWSPYNNVWQRMRSYWAVYYAGQITGIKVN